MNPPAQALSVPARLARWFLAWMMGGAIYFFTLVATCYDGFCTFVTGFVCGSVISAIGVAVSAILGLVLWLPALDRLWRRSLLPMAGMAALGLVLLSWAIAATHTPPATDPETGEYLKEVGSTWLPGHLLILFSIVNWPKLAAAPAEAARS